jgi:hypothetical protein
VEEELIAHLPGVNGVGLAATLYAAGGLTPDRQLDIADAAAALRGAPSSADEVALARLLAGIVPETARDIERLEALKGRLPKDSWKARAFLGTD